MNNILWCRDKNRTFNNSIQPLIYSLMVFSLSVMSNGCSSKIEQLPPTVQMSKLLNNRGIEALAQGSIDKALANFTKAIRLSESIEDYEGMTVASINLSRMYRKAEDFDAARRQIDRALEATNTSSPYYPDIAVEKAMILLHSEQLSEAEKWAMLALKQKTDDGEATRLNLLARIYFLQQNDSEAQVNARNALDAAGDNMTESANSYRLLGQIAMRKNNFPETHEHLLNALLWDKKSGNSPKIGLDLTLLADLFRLQGQTSAESAYLQRAYRVYSNANNQLVSEQIANRLNKLASINN